MLNVTSGIIARPVKCCVYGVEGIGKSTFASQFPDPLFFDLDGGTSRLNVKRVGDIKSWPQLMESVKFIYENPSTCRTIVIDTADAAERLCIEYICGKFGKKGIEDFGYGNGYTYLVEEFSRFLVLLETCITQGINVCILAHAVLKTVTLPDEMGQYDHWELKLSSKTTNKVAPLVKEWTDLLLFSNYETILVTDDKSKKQKAMGGRRMMWTSHTTFADAKNRFGLPDKLPFEYAQIAKCIPNGAAPEPVPEPEPAPAAKQEPEPPKPVTPAALAPKKPAPQTKHEALLGKVRALMAQAEMPERTVTESIAKKGYFPKDMPIDEYPDDFIEGVLIGAWDQIVKFIEDERIPF
jgi:hypothetical protein